MIFMFYNLMGNAKAWITILLVPFIAVIPDMVLKALGLYWPNPTEILMTKLRTPDCFVTP